MIFQVQSIAGTAQVFNMYNVVVYLFVTVLGDFGAAIRYGGPPSVDHHERGNR
jgi:hypothetical protein